MADVFPPDRPNPPDLVPFAEARAGVLERLRPLPVREVGLGGALGSVLAADVAAAEDLPPFANSAMDGFAVRGADLAGAAEDRPVALKITGEVFAGTGRLPAVEAGAAVRIMTGGALPPGAGEDVRLGTVVLERGRVLDPAAVGMLASVGRRAVPVHPRPRVTVVSTGDELVDPGDPLGPGQIRDSNSWLLVAQVRASGAGAFRCDKLRDDPEALRRGFAMAAAEGDFVLTSGGVSVGERDYTRQVLAELGDVRSFRVAMQPGMPQAFGFAAGTPLYGLPGNPVSCFVVFETLVRPALRRLAGHADDRLDRPRVVARLGGPVRSPAGKVSFLRVRLEVGDEGLVAGLTGNQGSGVLSSCVAADGLAVVPPEHTELAAGSAVQVILLRDDLAWVAAR